VLWSGGGAVVGPVDMYGCSVFGTIVGSAFVAIGVGINVVASVVVVVVVVSSVVDSVGSVVLALVVSAGQLSEQTSVLVHFKSGTGQSKQFVSFAMRIIVQPINADMF